MPNRYGRLSLKERREIQIECNKHEVPTSIIMTGRKCGNCPHVVTKRTDHTKTQYFVCRYSQRPHTWLLFPWPTNYPDHPADECQAEFFQLWKERGPGIGRKIARHRIGCMWTQEEFGKKIGLTADEVLIVERGGQPLDADSLGKIAKTLGCSYLWLVIGEKQKGESNGKL